MRPSNEPRPRIHHSRSFDCSQDAVDVIGEGGALALRASTSSVEFAGFLAAYSAHVIKAAASQPGDASETSEPEQGTDADVTSAAGWDGAGGVEPTAVAIRSLQVSLALWFRALCAAAQCSC